MLRLDQNPPIVTPSVMRPSELRGRWWVAHTRSRLEKAFAWDLLRRDIGYFLPLLERVRISLGRRYKILQPLFSSYVFFCGDDRARSIALATNRTCAVLAVPGQEELVRQLDAIHRSLACKAPLELYPHAVSGRRCRIHSGPLVGLQGVVVRRDRTSHVVLEVTIIGQGAMLEIDASLLEPLE